MTVGKQLPRYMNMRQMAEALGISKYLFRRLFDRHQLPHIKQGRDHILDTKESLKILAKSPGIDFFLSTQGVELMARVRDGKLQIEGY
jgi:hypothetical protein